MQCKSSKIKSVGARFGFYAQPGSTARCNALFCTRLLLLKSAYRLLNFVYFVNSDSNLSFILLLFACSWHLLFAPSIYSWNRVRLVSIRLTPLTPEILIRLKSACRYQKVCLRILIHERVNHVEVEQAIYFHLKKSLSPSLVLQSNACLYFDNCRLSEQTLAEKQSASCLIIW